MVLVRHDETEVLCPHCEGYGLDPFCDDADYDEQPCPLCEGTGFSEFD